MMTKEQQEQEQQGQAAHGGRHAQPPRLAAAAKASAGAVADLTPKEMHKNPPQAGHPGPCKLPCQQRLGGAREKRVKYAPKFNVGLGAYVAPLPRRPSAARQPGGVPPMSGGGYGPSKVMYGGVGGDGGESSKLVQEIADQVVSRFRSGHQLAAAVSLSCERCFFGSPCNLSQMQRLLPSCLSAKCI